MYKGLKTFGMKSLSCILPARTHIWNLKAELKKSSTSTPMNQYKKMIFFQTILKDIYLAEAKIRYVSLIL